MKILVGLLFRKGRLGDVMKKNMISCAAIFISFLVGFVLGMLVYANRDVNVGESVALCMDGMRPDANGCCAGEVYTDMGEQGFNCCPEYGDCFVPIR